MQCKENKRSGALHLTQKVDYAIILLASLAVKKELRSVKNIAEEKRLSFSFLQKVARELQLSGFIKAERGKNGGYRLCQTPEEISLKEIIEALEGPIAVVPCLKSSECSYEAYCTIRPGFKKLNEQIKTHFDQTSLANFLQEGKSQQTLQQKTLLIHINAPLGTL
ncbi:Rrf2 family transcriptional regulator [Candidatus Gracilibacteria bacterium]|nr:Rrf2 family transcriptional regulator [Candidatus Gracilibacteria bacterium]